MIVVLRCIASIVVGMQQVWYWLLWDCGIISTRHYTQRNRALGRELEQLVDDLTWW